MSYTDYNSYQQPSVASGFDSTGGYSSTYSQSTYDTTQYGTSDPYTTTDKDQQQYSQYDYSSYSSSYQQPAETSSPDYYSSSTNDFGLNSNSYSQQSYGQQATSSGYDASSGYQTSSYQYSSTLDQNESAMPSSVQNYSSSATTGFDYSTEANNYVDPTIDQYEQTSSSYNFGTNQSNTSTTGYSNPTYESQQSYPQNQQTTSSYSSSQQYSKPSNNYSQSSDFGGYHSINDGVQSGSYQNPTQSSSSGYQSNTQTPGTGSNSFQSSQPSSSGSYRPSNASGSDVGGRGGYQNVQSFNASSFDDGGFGGYSGPASGFNQNRKSDVWTSSSGGGSGNSSSGGGGFYKNSSESFGGFSYNPKKEHGVNSFSQHGGNSFSGMDNNYSQSNSNFSAQGGRGNKFNNNNNSSFSQRGVGSTRGAPITARNMGSQSRLQYNDQMTNDNMRPMSTDSSWRGPRGGGHQHRGGFSNSARNDQFNNRSSSRGGGKFNNFNEPRDNNNKGFSDSRGGGNRGFSDNRGGSNKGFSDNRGGGNKGFSDNRGGGNQFNARNQNSFGNNRDGKNKASVDSGPDNTKKNNESVSKTENVSQTDTGHSGAFHTNIAKKAAGKDDSGSKAPFYPNQKLLNEVDSKTNDKAKQSTSATPPSKIKEMTQDVRKETEPKIKEDEKKNSTKVTNKAPEQPVKPPVLAPPKKAPETPEEIAREEEIQRKILASIVVLDPDKEKQVVITESEKKVTDIDMSEELRDFLKTLTTDHFCKLCNVRLASPQMPVHYNGKNHFKKVRIFVQTNGRSAGFSDSWKTDDSDKSENEKKEDEDEAKYCKICKVTFLQDGQSEIHYKGKNHAKKLRQLNRADVYECKICSVVVSSQEVLTAHLNGAPHKMQIRKMEGDNAHRGGLHGRGAYRGGSRGGGRGGSADGADGGFRGRGISRGRGRGGPVGGGGFYRDGNLRISEEDEELYNLLGLTPEKRYKFDLANFRTPSGKFYCSSCDVVMEEEPHFLLHLGSRKHRDKAYKTKKDRSKIKVPSTKREKACSMKIRVERDMITFNRNH